jgi:hypothetical protein
MGIKELDQALTYLYPRYQYYETHDSLKEGCFNDSDQIDVEAIIIQLNKDGYLHYGISESNKEAQNNI